MKKVIISDSEKFQKLKKQFIADGFEKLHVVSDFDRTLTQAFNGGKFVPAFISVLRDENYLAPGYSEKAKALFHHYYAIEKDVSISFEVKKKAMEEWWEKHSRLLVMSGLNKKDLEKVAHSSKVRFREGLSECLNLLNQNKVPFVIISACGLGDDFLVQVLKNNGLYFPNIKIISNRYVWDEAGNAIDSLKPHIHTFNKNETSLKDLPVYSDIEGRKNVILLGDTLGDAGMVEGFEYQNLMKIGFLNDAVEENSEVFKKYYDVIITHDGSMEFLGVVVGILIDDGRI